MTKTKRLLLAAAVLSMAIAGGVAVAQTSQQISFARGTSASTVNGTIVGQQYRDYVLGARAGQSMTIRLTGNAYFNLLPPGSNDVAIYNSSNGAAGNDAALPLETSGNYRIRVYQMGAAERTRRPTRFTLRVGIVG